MESIVKLFIPYTVAMLGGDNLLTESQWRSRISKKYVFGVQQLEKVPKAELFFD